MKYNQRTFKRAEEVISDKLDKIVRSYVSDKFMCDDKYIVINNDGDYLGIIEIRRKKIKYDDIDKYDIKCDILGFKNLQEYKDKLRECFIDKEYVVLESLKVLEVFNVV